MLKELNLFLDNFLPTPELFLHLQLWNRSESWSQVCFQRCRFQVFLVVNVQSSCVLAHYHSFLKSFLNLKNDNVLIICIFCSRVVCNNWIKNWCVSFCEISQELRSKLLKTSNHVGWKSRYKDKWNDENIHHKWNVDGIVKTSKYS